jgi:hypothetical protein
MRKSGRAIRITCDHRAVSRDDRRTHFFASRLGAVVCAFAATRPDVIACRAEVSDGEESGAGIVSFCSTDRQAILIPDSDFFESRGYLPFRRLAGAAPRPWQDRDETVLWRGSTTGIGVVATGDLDRADPHLIQRVRMCLILRGVDGADAKISAIAQSPDPERDRDRLARAGVFGERIAAEQWIGRRFALDIDGNSNAWGNLFQRLVLGCCVIKVASPVGYRQWYYDDLEPWRHYVPVRADMADLVETIAWCRAHPAECEAIAAEGSALATRMTFEREFARGVANIEAALAAA